MILKARKLMVTLMAFATMAIVGCGGDDPTPDNPDNPGSGTELTSLAGTSWTAIYNDSYQGAPAVLTWSLDFTSETAGSLLLELTVAGQPQQPQDYAFTYTTQLPEITITIPGAGSVDLHYDAATNTITTNLGIQTEDGALGGNTTFYPRGVTPVPGGGNNTGGNTGGGEVTNEFPANTAWTSSEDAQYQGNPVTIDYAMDFANNHTGTISLTLSMNGQSQPAQDFSFTWTYDASSSTGTISIQGGAVPFAYDASTNQIYASFPFGFSQTETFGNNLVFNRAN